MFSLSQNKIAVEELAGSLNSRQAGALVCFEGRVRDENEGKKVLHLEYEAYEELALKEGNKIMQEALSRFPILECIAVHRLGKLEICESAVYLAVISKHRSEAFLACRYIIDEIKSRVPIWKKEFYTDGSSIWVNCADCSSHAPKSLSAHSHD